MTKFEDKQLSCRDCGVLFDFTIQEQEFFALKGLINKPRRCPPCRLVTRASRLGKTAELVSVNCDNCGAITKVTFKPTGRKPVFCLQCLHAARSGSAVAAM
jgi:CxxC-x17-CxxC domain-containing protein